MSVSELSYTEGAQIYIINGGAKGLKKGAVLKPDTNLRTDIYGFVNYSLYCFEQDIELGKEIIREMIVNAFEERRHAVESMQHHVTAGVKDVPIRRHVEGVPTHNVDLDDIAM